MGRDRAIGRGGSAKLALAAAAGLLSGCAADSSLVEQLMVVPGYYDTLGCPELTAKLRASTDRVRELILLMEKSGENAAGGFVNAIAYNTEYAKARSAQKNAEEAAVRKRCDLNAEPVKAPPQPTPAALSPETPQPVR